MKRFGLESSRVSSAVVALLVLFWVASIAPLGCTDNHSSNSGNTSQDGTFGDGGGDGLADDLALTDESAPDPDSTTGSEDAPSDLEAPDQEADLSPSPDLAPPDLSVGVDTAVAPDSSSGLGPLGKACVELLQNFCTGVLAKCDQLPIVGALITPTVISNCDSLVNASPQAQELACAQADSATVGSDLGPLVQFGPTLVKTCLAGFQCTTDTAIAVGQDLVPIVTDLAMGSSPDLLKIAGVALKLCLP